MLNVPVRHRRRHRAHRGRLRRRGRREHPPQADPGRRLRRQEGRDRDHLHRRDRQDRPQEREPVDHPRRLRRGRAAGAAEDPRGHDRLGAAAGRAASTPTRSSSRSTPRTSCSSAAARSPGSSKIIESRIGQQGRRLRRRHPLASDDATLGELLSQVLPEDLLKFGLIPEFVGRLPVIGAVAEPRPGGARPHPRRAEERAGQAVPEVLRVRGRRARVHRRRARGGRRPGAAAGHRRPRPAGDPRRGAAQRHVRPARAAPTSARCVIDGDDVLEKVNPTLVPARRDAAPAAPPPRRVLKPRPSRSAMDLAAALAYLDEHINLERSRPVASRRLHARAHASGS